MSIKHLPEAAAGIAAKQGWNDESIIIHLVGLIMDNMSQPEKAMELHFSAMADEENGDFEA